MFIQLLNEELDNSHLLKHQFCQLWNEEIWVLKLYKFTLRNIIIMLPRFPRYISGIHSLCPNLKMRQVLLGNLIEEEQSDKNHPELWQRFAEGFGVSRSDLREDAQINETQELVDDYFDSIRSGFVMALGALCAYERQTPEVSRSKIEGLKKHYSIDDERSLQFLLFKLMLMHGSLRKVQILLRI